MKKFFIIQKFIHKKKKKKIKNRKISDMIIKFQNLIMKIVQLYMIQILTKKVTKKIILKIIIQFVLLILMRLKILMYLKN